MPVYRIEVSARQRPTAWDRQVAATLREADLPVADVCCSRLFLVEGDLDRATVEDVTRRLLVDPVTETGSVLAAPEAPPDEPGALEVHLLPGVMDPTGLTTLEELRQEGLAVSSVRTAQRYRIAGDVDLAKAGRALANDCIERVVIGAAPIEPAPRPPVVPFELRHVPLRELDDAELARLSRDGHLFLSLEEMRRIQAHYRGAGREPTDLELETLAQTWSEHCVHKTLKSSVVYRGPGFPDPRNPSAAPGPVVARFSNLLKDTIARATEEVIASGRGPECLSVFVDNAGVIGFDDEYGIAFKVETHNHPSAIEPYGGAATGVGGCIRDVMGCGLGARPIANTDVFCVAPQDWPADALPHGVLHPRRVLRNVVRGVADYGNRMGIPTVNGAVAFDPRYLGNPLVYCGCVGLIPRDKINKAAQAGDRIVLIGGRTGRDGIHGATFSSAELSDTHADEFSHAVQIGNAITQKRVLDALLRARDAEGGCLYTAVTDCGAGGLSSAIGEMGAAVGATVDLERVPLKYAGLRYDEIWISEAQERMVLAVPPENVDALLAIAAEEEAEATVIGQFGSASPDRPELVVRYERAVVGRLDMRFLHHGWPRPERSATWTPPPAGSPQPAPSSQQPAPSLPQPAADVPREARASDLLTRLTQRLADPNVRSREWIIRQYDHEVQGASVIKPLGGPGRGPNDAAVLRPRLEASGGIAIGCGLAPELSDVDPYWMALHALDEAIRNVVAVGGDPRRTAVLDNFCWGRTDDPQRLAALVRACRACYDGAVAYGVPFISGKDSLNNEFALRPEDVEPLGAQLRRYGVAPAVIEAVRQRQRLAIPDTLLISAVSLIDDVSQCVTSDLKQAGNQVWLVGMLPAVEFGPADALVVHLLVADAIAAGLVAACHDASDGGWLVALAEMALGGLRGARIKTLPGVGAFDRLTASYVLEISDVVALSRMAEARGVATVTLGHVIDEPALRLMDQVLEISRISQRWRGVEPA